MKRAAFAFSLLAAGCGSVGYVPRAQLEKPQLTHASETGIVVAASVRIRNDHDYPIHVRRFSAHVRVGGDDWLQPMVARLDGVVAAQSAASFRFPVVIPWRLVSQLTRAARRQPHVAFEVVGFATVEPIAPLVASDFEPTAYQIHASQHLDMAGLLGCSTANTATALPQDHATIPCAPELPKE